ncbi:DNA-3-methyladenine glycosylase I [Agarivorans sp. 1_MG-2023]|uniref:DNA-3-methyladenine glycosylase I n=1 Tax=Agarivorans sp. 1_MG-2023 TaxID=3062634 RepID=UPI0026E1D2E0|nr:DNA-3-methyladenine glycosylase I [Agarivorans sp. 1_MG-2023]MDO6765578.1 DNA-3-methyladenine glycosylase I [Agarivorans sp. 1_MG-2023]
MKVLVEDFSSIWQRAAERKGGDAALQHLLTTPLSREHLAGISDDRWLSAFTKTIFQSGFVWRVVENKWPDFERAFFDFEPEKMLMLDDSHIERLCNDASIIRNRQKIITVPQNAQMILDMASEHGSFAKFIAQWPTDDIVGLWLFLKKHGARLGGNSAPYALRRMGKDTFILSGDVVAYLVNRGVVTKAPTSIKGLKAVQQVFNSWQQQSGMPLAAISQTVAYSIGENNL